MFTSTVVEDELHDLHSQLFDLFGTMAQEKPSIVAELEVLHSRLTDARNGRTRAADVLVDTMTFLAQLETSKDTESATFADALANAQARTRTSVVLLLTTATG